MLYDGWLQLKISQKHGYHFPNKEYYIMNKMGEC